MTGRGRASAEGRTRLLAGGRAGGLLMLVSGINGLAVFFAPRYEPIYAFLAAIAIVAFLGGAWLGVFAAIAGVLTYEFLFSPLLVPSVSAIVPLSVAAIAVAMSGLARVTARSPMLGAGRRRDVLPRGETPIVSSVPEIRRDWESERNRLERSHRDAIAESHRLRDELEQRLGESERARLRVGEIETELTRIQQLREEDRITAGNTIRLLSEELTSARGERQRLSGEIDALRSLVASGETRIRQHGGEAGARINELEGELVAAVNAAENLRAEHDAAMRHLRSEQAAEIAALRTVIANEREQNESSRVAIDRLRDSLTGVSAEAGRSALLERTAQQTAEQSRALEAHVQKQAAEIRALEARIQKGTVEARAVDSRVQQQAVEIENARRLLVTERERAADLGTQLTVALEEAEKVRTAHQEARAREMTSAQEMASLRNELNVALRSVESERRRADSLAGGLTAALGEMETLRVAQRAAEEIEPLRQQLAAARAQIDEEKANRARADTEWDAKLQQIVHNVTSDFEEQIGEATMEREGARAEVRMLEQKQQALLQQLEELTVSRDLLQRDRALLQQSADDERARAAEERAARERIEADWNEKLQKIVTNLASDFEGDIGEATMQKEAARAEARSLTMRLRTLQQKLDGDRETFLAAEQKWNATRDQLLERVRQADERSRDAVADGARVLAESREAWDRELARVRDEIAVMRGQPSTAALQEPAEPVEPPWSQTTPGLVPLPLFPAERLPRVLVVLQDPGGREMAKTSLERAGFEALIATDGLDALRIATSRKPDVVVADASMSKMGGRELCQFIKSNQATARIKVILMIGAMSRDLDQEPASEFAPDAWLRKPIKFETMRATLEELLKS